MIPMALATHYRYGIDFNLIDSVEIYRRLGFVESIFCLASCNIIAVLHFFFQIYKYE